MTIPSTPRKAGPFLGNGATTSFPFTFKVFAATDVKVVVADSAGAETVLALNSDYAVTLNPNQDTSPGGTVTYPLSGSPLPSGSVLSIIGDLDYDQPLDLPSGGNFSPLALENQLDRTTMQIQQLRESISRALLVPATSSATPSLPAPGANQLIGWDASGSNLQNVPIEDLATAVTYGTFRYDTFTGDGVTTQFTPSANPTTIANLDVSVNGLTLVPGSDYTLSSGVVVFAVAPAIGAKILVRYGEAMTSAPGDAADITYHPASGPATTVQARLRGYESSGGSALIGYLPAGTGAVATNVQSKLREWVSVKDFGAVGEGADESAAANAMIAAHNYLYVPPNFTLVCKNIELFNGTRVICEGTLKLPSACADFDRLLYATNKAGIEIDVRELDGNYAGQSGDIGTHLIYTTGCDDISINVKYAHDHYIASGALMPSVDGIRNSSSGGIFVYNSNRAKVNVGLFEGWGREAIWLYRCRWGDVTLGHAQGKYLTEYSGLQVEGSYNNVNRASVDFAGASAVGFDTRYGTLSNVIATNTRENSGVNFGHPGEPATGSVAENIVVDGTFGSGITVAASSHDVSINNFTVRNTGEIGISFSDGVLRGKLSNGVLSFPSRWGLVTSGAEVQTSNVRSADLDAATLLVNVTSGTFAEGETVTSNGGSATIRKVVRNLTGSQVRLFFTSNVPASYVVGNAITSSGGASGTIAGVYVPVEYNEVSGGVYLRDPRYFPGTGNQIRFPDGTAIYTWNVACAHTTAGTEQTFTQSFTSNVVWASAPYVVASVGSVSSTDGFTLARLSATATTLGITILLNASVNQTYGVQVIAIGRWK